MKSFINAALSFLIVFSAAATISSIYGNAQHTQIDLSTGNSWMPGSRQEPPAGNCELLYRYGVPQEFCEIPIGPDNSIEVTYDFRRHVVSQTTVPGGDILIGDLVSAWGAPSGVLVTSETIFVYWSDSSYRHAWVKQLGFSPYSKVELITYTLNGEKSSPWKGFIQYNSQENSQ